MFQTHHLLSSLPFSYNFISQNKNIEEGPFLLEKITFDKQITSRKFNMWNNQNNLQYLACVYYLQNELTYKKGRDLWQLYKLMEKVISGKNANQIRIYHKRMIKQNVSINNIISVNYQKIYFQSSNFDRYIYQITDLRSKLDIKQNCKQSSCLQTKQIISSPPRIDYYVPNPLYPEHSCIEDKKQEMLPTDTGYQQQIAYKINKIKNEYSNQKILNQLNQQYFQSKNNKQILNKLNQKQQQWKQCHQLFLLWTNKLKKLLHTQQNNKIYK